MGKNKKLIVWGIVLVVVIALVLFDVLCNAAGSVKLLASIFLPGIVAPIGSSVSDGLQTIAIIPDIWVIVLVLYGVMSHLKPKVKHSAA